MENKAHALAAGAFVLVLAALLAALAVWLTRDVGQRRIYEVSTRDAVTGLQSQAAVRFRGVKIGKVSSIGFDPKSPGAVLLRLELDVAAPVTRSTYATLGYQGLTGIAFVQLDDSEESRELLADAEGAAPRIPMRPGLMDQWTRKGERLLSQLEETTRRVNLLLAPENQQALRKTIESAGTSFDAMRESAVTVKAAAAQVRQTAQDYSQLSQRIQQPGGAVEQLQQGAGALAGAGQTLQQSALPRLNRTLDDASRSARRIGRAAATLDENPQALLYGPLLMPPGPGEPGFVAPAGSR